MSLLKKLLNESGLGYLWENQVSLKEQKSYYCAIFKDRIQDIMFQNLNTDISNVSNNRLYKHIDHDFYGKDYIRTLKPKHLRVALSKLRLGSHNFMIERGRWTRPSIEYTHRLCKTCDMLEDEMHIFFECDRYLALRKQFLPSYLFKNPSMYKFIDFLHKADGNLLLNLSRFCYYVFKDYDENEL